MEAKNKQKSQLPANLTSPKKEDLKKQVEKIDDITEDEFEDNSDHPVEQKTMELKPESGLGGALASMGQTHIERSKSNLRATADRLTSHLRSSGFNKSLLAGF